jgi:predicted MFS family arabinose efflux permease
VTTPAAGPASKPRRLTPRPEFPQVNAVVSGGGYGVGSVAGSLGAGRLPRRALGVRALAAALAVQTCCLVVLGTVRSLTAAIAAMAVFGALGAVWNVNEVTLLQQRTPADLLGRVSAANRTLSVAGAPLGALLGGATAAAWGLNTPPLAAAVLFCCAAGVLIPAGTV